MTNIPRRTTITTHIGSVSVGSCHPVVVQSMTNTDTADVPGTVEQVSALAEAGSELVRVTVNNDAAAQAVPTIVEQLEDRGVSVPIIGDFHYNGHILLTKFPDCARALAKYRINPGNVGSKRRDENFQAIIAVALEHDKPVRIGVNWGSLDQDLLTRMMDQNAGLPQPKDARDVMIDAMIESALRSAELAEDSGLGHDRIVISAKVSGVQDLIEVYRLLAARCDYPLHLGLTEAGMGAKGVVASTAGMSVLLQEGIGDTIRVSLTPAPGGDRTEEVRVAQQILQSMGLRSFTPQVTACPGCGRTTSSFFQEMAQDIEGYIRTSGRRCPSGAGSVLALPTCPWRSWDASSTAQESPSTPTSASPSPAPLKNPRRRCTSMGRCTPPSRATTSWPSSWPSSRTTWQLTIKLGRKPTRLPTRCRLRPASP